MKTLNLLLLFVLLPGCLLFSQESYYANKIVTTDIDANLQVKITIEDGTRDNIAGAAINDAFHFYYHLYSDQMTDEQLQTDGRTSFIWEVFSNSENNRVGSNRFDFLETFRVAGVNTQRKRVSLYDYQKETIFEVSFKDFDRAFIWQNQMLDRDRLYMPLIGFTSIESEAKTQITIRKGPSHSASDTGKKIFDYDAYKIVDYKNGFYLIADLTDLRYAMSSPAQIGVIGWVPQEYVVFWVGRRYQKITDPRYFDALRITGQKAPNQETLNVFKSLYLDTDRYIRENFPSGLSPGDIDLFERFYRNGGAYYTGIKTDIDRNTTAYPVALISNYNQYILSRLVQNVKSDVRVMFLLDRSSSMKHLIKFCETFTGDFQRSEFRSRTSIFSYLERRAQDRSNILSHQNYHQMVNVYGTDRDDLTYTENLLPSLRELLQTLTTEEKHLLRSIFIVTSAGDNKHYHNNDMSDFNAVVSLAKEKGVHLVFIIPDRPPPIDPARWELVSHRMKDTPQASYDNLLAIVGALEQQLNRQGVKQVDKKIVPLHIDIPVYRKITKEIVADYDTSLASLTTPSSQRGAVVNPYYPDMTADENLNISFYQSFLYQGRDEYYENRIAIDFESLETMKGLLNVRRPGANFNEMFKQIIVLTNLYGYQDIDNIESQWNRLQERYKRYNQNREFNEAELYRALTGGNMIGIRVNDNLSDIILNLKAAERSFNFNVVTGREGGRSRYVYLLQSEVFNR